MGVIIIFSLSHCHVDSVGYTDHTLGDRAYDVGLIVEVTLDNLFHLFDRRCFRNEQGAVHLRLGAGENGIQCESWPKDLCHVSRNSLASPGCRKRVVQYELKTPSVAKLLTRSRCSERTLNRRCKVSGSVWSGT